MTHTIIVVDEEQAQREHLCSVLKEKLAYNAVGIASGREASEYVMTEHAPKPDLILCDVTGSAGGCEAIAHLRILTAQTPIIALVKFGDYEAAMAAMSAGAQDFLNKPVATERLGTTFRNALLLRDARRETEWLRKSGTGGGAASHGHNSMLLFSLIGTDGNIRRIEEIEAEAIRFAMQFYNGRMTEVARRLGIGRSTLYRKLNDLSIRVAAA